MQSLVERTKAEAHWDKCCAGNGPVLRVLVKRQLSFKSHEKIICF